MKINRLSLARYKRVNIADLVVADVNVIVGGNNGGKSSVLQGIHFAITVATTGRQQAQTTFASDLLPYNPTPDFSVLRHGSPYLNHAGTGDSKLVIYANAAGEDGAQEEISYSITLYKGRNHGNIGCNRQGDYARLGAEVTDPNSLYSIYVPGLAGIAQQEELRAKAIIRRGTASGDANLYLRNIIFYIKQTNKLAELNRHLSSIFPSFSVDVTFDEDNDHRLNVNFTTEQGTLPIELSGTGLLQVLQIYSYITYFSPKLLLLDEPDSHLHPDNQAELCHAITQIAQSTGCQIILCTHSRHVVDEFTGFANFIWLKNGEIQAQGMDIPKLPLLLDLGALDSFDRLRAGQVRLLVLTEDRDRQFIDYLLRQNGFLMEEALIYSYKTSSNLEGAILFVDFLREMAPQCRVVIHRDRDFMTHDEAERVRGSIESSGALSFITQGSDIESYFVSREHLCRAFNQPEAVISEWLDAIALAHHNELQLQFTRKRDDIRNRMYRDNRDVCPATFNLLGNLIPLPVQNRKGKFMLSKVRGTMHERMGRVIDLKSPTQALLCETLQKIRGEVWPAMGA
jgi:energy-coupling factor transporter ATP-binding protein EcfA2